MSIEGIEFDKKSLAVLTRANPGWDDLACDCVAFANARGGCVRIGIEDDEELPSPGQRVEASLVEQVRKRIPQLTVNVAISVQKVTTDTGGEFIELQVLRAPGIAATSDGRYFIRIADETKRLMPDELQRLLNDKGAYIWEAQTAQGVPRVCVDETKRAAFLKLIRASDRVSTFVKEKADDEVLDYYLFTKHDLLTNLGVLWIGRREDRATLAHAPVIQFIKYDETGVKVNKLTWDDFSKNPMGLIEAVWTQVPDWRESYELPDGLFRKNIPHFDEVVVRELLANALVHRPYTMRGDIFLNLHPDRLEVHNPGLLPLGVTPNNILHTTVKRNELLAKVFYDLKLMEREGSGFDRMYEALLTTGRPAPVVLEGGDRVVVTVQRRIVKREVVDFVAKADQAFHLTQKERIALGLIAQHESITALHLAKFLELKETEDLKRWIDQLLNLDLVKKHGRTKGVEYFVDPGLLRKLDFKGSTTLKGIEKHRLRELVLRDLGIYQEASIGQIHKRIGMEIPLRKLQRTIYELCDDNLIMPKGERKGRRYLLTKTGGNNAALVNKIDQ